jgi:hypothetical protein
LNTAISRTSLLSADFMRRNHRNPGGAGTRKTYAGRCFGESLISFWFSARHWQQIEAGRPIMLTALFKIYGNPQETNYSAAGRKRIAAAQRARWAKVKAGKKLKKAA